MDFSKIRLICCDLDGTLLAPDGSATDGTLAAITRLSEKGIEVVPATGRSIGAINKRLRHHPAIRYIISSDGSVINDLKTGERDEELLSGDTLKRVVEIITDYEVLFVNHVNGEDVVAAEEANEEKFEKCNVSPYYRKFIMERTVRSESREKLLSEQSVEFVCGIFACQDDYDAAKARILEIDGVAVASADPRIMEVVNEMAGKGNGVIRLAKKLGLPLDCVITVGDGENDLSMIRATPASFAMENGRDILKREARYIACRNSDGLAEYLEGVIEGRIIPKISSK